MPLYLVRINKRSWDRDAFSWLKSNQVPADVYRDLRIMDGSLSVWHVEDDKSNLEMVITALAATRDRLDVFDYGLFDQVYTSNSDIRAVPTGGISPIPSTNHWHRDLVELTVDNLAELLRSIFDVMEKERISKRDIGTMISKAAQSSQIDLSQVKSDKMKKEIEEFINK